MDWSRQREKSKPGVKGAPNRVASSSQTRRMGNGVKVGINANCEMSLTAGWKDSLSRCSRRPEGLEGTSCK
jgi:hypothetical protein